MLFLAELPDNVRLGPAASPNAAQLFARKRPEATVTATQRNVHFGGKANITRPSQIGRF
jgi:hypothetical protein